MEKIESFKINHDLLLPGLYISRIDDNVVTYDIRTRIPNKGDYMTNAAMHTVEHLFATYVRNSARGNEIIYFGPMGCRTGFYLLVKDSLIPKDVISLVVETFRFILSFEGDIPGAERKECGNYLEHDLDAAKKEARDMLEVLPNWTEANLKYLTEEENCDV